MTCPLFFVRMFFMVAVLLWPLSGHALSWQTFNLWKETGAHIYFSSGNVGVGTTTPSTTMAVSGTLLVGNGSEICNASYAGGLRYNSGASTMQFCNGSSWTDWGSASSAATSLVSMTTDVSIVTPTSGQVLRYDGSKWVNATESDPQVGANTTNYLSKWNGSAMVTSVVYETASKIGIGTTTPSAVLDVAGSLLVGDSGETCNSTHAGALRYNALTNKMQYCNGTSWSTGADGYTLSDYSTLNGIYSIGTGLKESCAVSRGGAVYCWGYNYYGQLGDNTTTTSYSPVQVKGVGGTGTLSNISALSTGNAFTCAAATDGSVYCWGLNTNGQLGDNTTTDLSTPVQVKGVGGSGTLSGISQVKAGAQHTCALTTSGDVYCWGLNSSGQLGDSTSTSPRKTPVQVTGVGGSSTLSDISYVQSGSSHTCAVDTASDVYCWGLNTNGQLGNNTTTSSTSPLQVVGVGGSGTLSGISSLATGGGSSHTCALTTGGEVYCWGLNTYGQLGDSTTTERHTPVQVTGVGGSGTLSSISAITAGSDYTCALSTGGSIYCWGLNTYGQLGDNTTTERHTPVQVTGVGGSGTLSNIASITSAYTHTCAVTNLGALYCWGRNDNGKLGDTSTTDRSAPVQVMGVGAQDSTNHLSKWNSNTALVTSRFVDDGTYASIGGATNASYALTVYGGGVGAAGAYTNTSDIRLKTDVDTFSHALDKVRRLRGVSFTWKDSSNLEKGPQLGFIAQEVEKIVPEVVITQSNGYKAMKYGNLTAVLVEAVKELATRAAASDSQLKAAQAENLRLRRQLADQGVELPILPHTDEPSSMAQLWHWLCSLLARLY